MVSLFFLCDGSTRIMSWIIWVTIVIVVGDILKFSKLANGKYFKLTNDILPYDVR